MNRCCGLWPVFQAMQITYLTLEHARERADIPHVTFEEVAA
jgi:hypothetical protein